METRDEAALKAPLPCWFCGRKLPVERVLRDGILLSREEARGGPQRLLLCPGCLKENLCERTRRGRWFASPNVTVGVLDFLFSPLAGDAAEEILQAISWYRDHEARRRDFFLADGDARYSRLNLLRRLCPFLGRPRAAAPAREEERGRGTRPRGSDRPRPSTGRSPPPGSGTRDGPGRRRTRAGAEGQGGASGPSPGRGSPGKEGARGRGGARPSGAPRPGRSAVVTPYEVLGLTATASQEEVRRAFHRLAVQYHPDKVHHLGSEFEAVAHVKFQELLRAYETLMSTRR